MQVQLKRVSAARLRSTLLTFVLLPTAAIAQVCHPVIVAERGDAPDKAAAAALYPRITIETPGRFCLSRDVHQDALRDFLRRSPVYARHEAVIRIRADDVNIDLSGHSVSNAMQDGLTLIWFSKFVVGEQGGARLSRASIANGILLSPGAAGVGIDLTASNLYGAHSLQFAPVPPGTTKQEFFKDTSHLIESVRIHAGKRAILIDGKNNVIRNNRITVDGTTAIVAQGPGVVIENNVIEVGSDPNALGESDRRLEAQAPFVIRLIQADGAIVRNNEIRLLDRPRRGSLPAAIELVETTGALVEGNVLGGMDRPVQADGSSSFQEARNSFEACPAGATRFLPPGESLQAADRQPLPPCR